MTAPSQSHLSLDLPSKQGLSKAASRRQVDARIIASWVEAGESVLDLGCGRGLLLDYLRQQKSTYGIGVDISSERIAACIHKGLNVFQGDIVEFLKEQPDKAFDRVVFSRTVEELSDPQTVLLEALRVGRRVAVGFINHGFWRNRLDYLFTGNRRVNPVYPRPWWQSRPSNPLSRRSFEAFTRAHQVKINRRMALAADWEKDCTWFPGLFAGYLIYDIERQITP